MKLFSRLLLWASVCALAYACNEAEEETPAPEIPLQEALNTTYTNRAFPENVLALNYCGQPLSDKDADFNTGNMLSARITLDNVIPGEKSTSFIVDMGKQDDGTFPLTMTDNRLVTASGAVIEFGRMSIKRGRLSIDIDNVTYPDNSLSHNKYGTGWWTTDASPLHIRWKVTPGTYPLSTGATVEVTEEANVNPGIVALLPSIINSMLISPALSDIHFGRNGRIRAVYSPLDTEAEPQWTLSPDKNLCLYYVKDGMLMVKPSITEILNETSITRAEEEGTEWDPAAVQKLLELVAGWMTDGIPLEIRPGTDGSTTLCLTLEHMDGLMEILGWLLVEYKDEIAELIPGDMGGIVGPMIEVLGVYAANTEEFELGLRLTPTASPAN